MTKRISALLLKWLEDNRISGGLIIMVTLLIVIGLSFSRFYKTVELMLLDLRFSVKSSLKAWERLAIIDIDEDSIKLVGEYPWTRNIYAAGLDVQKELNTFQDAMDIIFVDDSPYQVNMDRFDELQKKGRLKAADLDSLIIDHDAIFTQALLRDKQAVMSYVFNSDKPTVETLMRQKAPAFLEARQRFEEISSIAVPKNELKRYQTLIDPTLQSLSYPIIGVMESGRIFGYVNKDLDIDGTLRKIPLVTLFRGRIYFHLALSMIIDMCRVKKADISIVPGERIRLKNAFNPYYNRMMTIDIPIDERGMMYLNWAGKWERSFKIVSYQRLIDYSDFAGDAFDYFDRVENAGHATGNSRLSRLFNALNEKISLYHTSPGGDAKKLWTDIAGLKKTILKTEQTYAIKKKKEIDALKKDLKSNGDNPGLKNQIEKGQELMNILGLVMELQSLAGDYTITGVSAISAHDIGNIPIQKKYPGVGVYPNAVNTILQGGFLTRPAWWINILLMLCAGIIIGFLVQRFDARRAFIIIGLFFLVVNLSVVALFMFGAIWIDQLGISLALLVPSLTITSFKFIKEEGEKRFIQSAFSRYLSGDVIDEIIANPESLELGGENREITIFFSDIASFSSISEKLIPAELVTLINEYLSEMTTIIQSYKGTVDKFIGDAIMAFYGAPHFFEGHELNACYAAIDMKRRLREMQEFWRKHGQDEIHVRMGINTGPAVVGNMGSNTRMDYTAMGDSVNLASRLEGANKFYKTYAMMSGYTEKAVRDHVETRSLDIIRVKGKSEAIPIYELLGLKGALPDRIYDMMKPYNRGLEYFSKRDWKEALKYFKRALKIVDDDGPSITYCERCEKFIRRPPSKKWDGVYSFKTK